jgi:hypothetical protein
VLRIPTNPASGVVSAKNMRSRLSEELGRLLIQMLDINALVNCPVDEMRGATCDMAFEMCRVGRGKLAFEWFIKDFDKWFVAVPRSPEFLILMTEIVKNFPGAKTAWTETG